LSPREAADEALVMGLRLAEGLDPGQIAHRLGVDALVDPRAVEVLTESGHLDRDGARIRATPAGRLILDHLLAKIAA
jgi:oxygen-independent coproporphyrinogen-3 oxidase